MDFGPETLSKLEPTIETSPSAQPSITLPRVFAMIVFWQVPRSSSTTSRYCCLEVMETALLPA